MLCFHSSFSHMSIHRDLVYSFSLPNIILLNDKNTIYLSTLQLVDTWVFSSFSLSQIILQLTWSYLSLSAQVWFQFCLHLDSIPRTRQKSKVKPLVPWAFWLASGFYSRASYGPQAPDHSDKFDKWPHCADVSLFLAEEGREAVFSTSTEPKLTITALHWDLYTFQFLAGHSVTQVSFQKKNWGSL